MNIPELKKVIDFIRNANFIIEIVDFNTEEKFEASLVQVNVKSNSDIFCYQTAQSSNLSINNSSGAIDALIKIFIKNGFESEFVGNNLDEISNLIKKILKVQELYDEYIAKFGKLEECF
jgi:hypothetical protein